MKFKSTINKIGKAVFFLCLLVLALDNIFNVKINFNYYFYYFWGVYLFCLLLLIFTSKHKIYMIIFVVFMPIIVLVWGFLNTDHSISFRESILNSEYDISAQMYGYQVMERYSFVEKVVAEKKSDIFFDSYSKIGVINTSEFEVKLLDDTKKMITIEINTTRNRNTVDTLRRMDF